MKRIKTGKAKRPHFDAFTVRRVQRGLLEELYKRPEVLARMPELTVEQQEAFWQNRASRFEFEQDIKERMLKLYEKENQSTDDTVRSGCGRDCWIRDLDE